jgi:hypothetical protein
VHWKCGQAKVMRISIQPFRNTDFDRSKATAECGIFKISGSQAINSTKYACEIKFRTAIVKEAFNKAKTYSPAN